MAQCVVEVDGEEYSFEWSEGTLLQAMLDAGVPAPYSCQAGQCGACQCYVEGAATTMLNNNVLFDDEIAEGQRLACQTVRDGDDNAVEVSYYF